MTRAAPFGVAGVFAAPDAMLATARQLRELGFREVEAYTPYPVEELGAILRPRRPALLPALIFVGAWAGAAIGYFIQYWGEVLDYPLNVGGRPLNSWPAFAVGAFEIMLLLALSAGFFGLLVRCRLPLLYHPMFAAAAFERASRDRFVLCVEARDPSYDPGFVRRIFERHGAEQVCEVAG